MGLALSGRGVLGQAQGWQSTEGWALACAECEAGTAQSWGCLARQEGAGSRLVRPRLPGPAGPSSGAACSQGGVGTALRGQSAQAESLPGPPRLLGLRPWLTPGRVPLRQGCCWALGVLGQHLGILRYPWLCPLSGVTQWSPGLLLLVPLG